MSIEDPISYADWYWKHSVDAKKFTSDEAEKAYAAIVGGLIHDSGLYEFMPDFFKPMFDTISEPTASFWDDIQRPFMNTITRVTSMAFGEEIARPGVYAMKAGSPTLKIDADMAAILTQRRLMSEAVYNVYASFAGYDEGEASQFYKTRLPYPAIPDIITASRYLGDPYNPKAYAQSLFDIPDTDFMVWDWMTYQKLTTEQVLSLYRREHWGESPVDTELARLGWRLDDSRAIKMLAYDLPNPMLLAQSGLVQNASKDTIISNISKAGIHPSYADDYYNAVLTKPASQDIIAYELRRDPSLSNLDGELRRIGIHPNYNSLYRELAYQIPPVADIITMAVREAFTPAIARRFGQYEDLPTEYVEAVQKKGLSREWAERYWAAHWSLPSPQQGFEMLHRGVIGEGDLNMLMRALDIMPFWRDKLTQIAYRPLSRVDVRRMYALGVLDVSGVRKAYTDLGYNDYNADLMTKFTIKYTEGIEERAREAKERAEEREQEAKEKAILKEEEAVRRAAIPKVSEWTTAQTLKFLTTKLISEERARNELELLGYNEERISVYLASLKPVP